MPRRIRSLIVMALVSLSACVAQFQDHGYIPSQSDLDRVVIGVDHRNSLERLVGRPSSTGLLEDSGWYYVRSRYRTYAAAEPVEIDRQVVAISFDDRGKVENVERFGLEQGRVVALERRVTDSNIKGISFLQQLFGNFGRIDASNLIDP